MVYEIKGNWSEGFAFDIHTTSSTFLGTDPSGHSRYETERSKMGELLYQLKYNNVPEKAGEIAELLDQLKGIENFGALVPIPPTKRDRPYQPVFLVAEALGKRRNVPVLFDLLHNAGTAQLKSVPDQAERDRLLRAAITISNPDRINGLRILLVDDLYRSGSTLKVATNLIMSKSKAESVCVLALTKTRSAR